MQGLGDVPGGNVLSSARDVSADGQVVVGRSISFNGEEGFRWTPAGGMVGIGDLPGGGFASRAYGVSSDGSVMVGYGESQFGQEAFRWTSSGGMSGLGDLPGGVFQSLAQAVSTDGAFVVGYSQSAFGLEAFFWKQGPGMVGLGDLPGGAFWSLAYDVSLNERVVGASHTDNGDAAFLWDETNGMIHLFEMLQDNGIDVSGWTQSSARSISDDGKVIVGHGVNPEGKLEGWVIKLESGNLPLVTPEGWKLLDGILTGGQVADLFHSDDQYFELEPYPTSNSVKQKIHLILQATSTTETPATLRFRLEAKMLGWLTPGDVVQSIELFNYNTHRYEILDSRPVGIVDGCLEFTVNGNPSRFVQSGTREITAGLTWKSVSFSGATFDWVIDVDQAAWSIIP